MVLHFTIGHHNILTNHISRSDYDADNELEEKKSLSFCSSQKKHDDGKQNKHDAQQKEDDDEDNNDKNDSDDSCNADYWEAFHAYLTDPLSPLYQDTPASWDDPN